MKALNLAMVILYSILFLNRGIFVRIIKIVVVITSKIKSESYFISKYSINT